MTTVYKAIAMSALILGIGHIIFGIVVFKAYTLEVVWFMGAGVAMIVVAITNLSGQTPVKLRVGQNFIMMIYCFAILGIRPAPQVILACLLFGGLFAVTVIESLRKED